MSISKDDLVKRKEQIKKDFDALVEQIKEQIYPQLQGILNEN